MKSKIRIRNKIWNSNVMILTKKIKIQSILYLMIYKSYGTCEPAFYELILWFEGKQTKDVKMCT